VWDSTERRALMSKPQQQGFVVETSGRAVLAFLAGGIEQARDLCTQDWFVEELASYRSCGHPLWDGAAELGIRLANACEAIELRVAQAGERARKEYEGYVFVFLVPVDAEPQ
jgi:hypothetical protein